jgi:uncharacterized membrane protein YkvA (DUF1232 family)
LSPRNKRKGVKLKLQLMGNDLGEYDLTPVEPYLKSLPRLIRAFLVALVNPDVSPWMKMFAVSGIVYFFSPLDIIPDFITGIGFVDDVILMLLIMQAFLTRVPRPVLDRILGADAKESVFFNVKDGLTACKATFSSVYDKVMDRFDALITKSASITPTPQPAETKEDAGGQSN